MDEGTENPPQGCLSPSSSEEGEPWYLSIATPLQHLVRRVSGMRFVGNEVGALNLVDGLDLGEGCQVFVIKDFVIHLGLGKSGTEGQKQKSKRDRTGGTERGLGKRLSR